MCRVENLWVLGFTSYTIFVSIVGLIRHDVAAAYNLSNDVGRYVSVRGSFCAHEYGACEALWQLLHCLPMSLTAPANVPMMKGGHAACVLAVCALAAVILFVSLK
jgi:hypothetical protein